MNKEATQRPWKTFGNSEDWPGIEASGISIVVYGNPEEEDFGVQGSDKEQAHANAALIVQAVNSYDDLVAALEPFAKAKWTEAENDQDVLTMSIPKRYLVRARSALSKAQSPHIDPAGTVSA